MPDAPNEEDLLNRIDELEMEITEMRMRRAVQESVRELKASLSVD